MLVLVVVAVLVVNFCFAFVLGWWLVNVCLRGES